MPASLLQVEADVIRVTAGFRAWDFGASRGAACKACLQCRRGRLLFKHLLECAQAAESLESTVPSIKLFSCREARRPPSPRRPMRDPRCICAQARAAACHTAQQLGSEGVAPLQSLHRHSCDPNPRSLTLSHHRNEHVQLGKSVGTTRSDNGPAARQGGLRCPDHLELAGLAPGGLGRGGGGGGQRRLPVPLPALQAAVAALQL